MTELAKMTLRSKAEVTFCWLLYMIRIWDHNQLKTGKKFMGTKIFYHTLTQQQHSIRCKTEYQIKKFLVYFRT